MRHGLLAAGVLAGVTALPAAQSQPTFKTKVTHVQVDVVVTDRDDRPVTDLTAGEFEIWERGRKQTISDFEVISVPLAGREIDLNAAPAPPVDVASNAAPPRNARAFVFVMDDATLSTATITWIKQWMTEFLSHLHADDQVAITYVGRSDLSQDFTRDAGLLVRAVNNLRAALGSGMVDQCRGTVPVMKNVVRSVAAARETRRAVVLFAERFPTPLGCINEVQELYQQATRAGVPIYAFSPTGLTAPELGLDGPLEMQTPEARAARDNAVKQGKENLITLSLNTGARAFVYQSDQPRAIRELVTENSSYYLLGYYPNPDVADGRFHDIDVKVTRPGLRVRARAGYDARKPVTPRTRTPRLVDSLTGGLPGGDLLVRGFVAPVSLSRNRARTVLTLDVTYPGADGAAPRKDDDLRLAWVAIDADARIRASGQNNVRVPTSRAGQNSFTVSINHALDLPNDAKIVRLVVASSALSRQGVVHLPVAVPVWPGQVLEVTPLVLGTSADPNRIVAGLGASARVLPFQPTTARTFTPGDRLQIFSRIYADTAADVTAELVVRQQGLAVRRAVVPLSRTSPSEPRECRATLSLANLTPGRYILELVTETGLERVVRQVPFEINPITR
jgi:VWFA-related protein